MLQPSGTAPMGRVAAASAGQLGAAGEKCRAKRKEGEGDGISEKGEGGQAGRGKGSRQIGAEERGQLEGRAKYNREEVLLLGAVSSS